MRTHIRARKRNGAGHYDAYLGASESIVGGLSVRESDVYTPGRLRGEVFMNLHDVTTGKLIDSRHYENIITKDASILLARLCKDAVEPTKGIFALAVGTGDVGWNLQSPPAATSNDRTLVAEIARKQTSSSTFIDVSGNPTAIPTNIVDFSTTFSESEAVGPLVEMGLIASPIDITPPLTAVPVTPATPYNPTIDLTNYDTLFNKKNFAVLNKNNTTTLTLVWRITF